MNSVIIRNKLAGFSMLASGRLCPFDFHGFQFDRLLRLVVRSSRQFRNFGGDIHSFDHLAKDGVLVIEPGRRRDGNEKLAAVCAGSGIGHGKFSRLVMLQGRMKFVAKAIAGIAGPRSERASALNHELRDHAMENEAVVKRALHFLPGLGSLNSLVPSRGQRNSRRSAGLPFRTDERRSFPAKYRTRRTCLVRGSRSPPGRWQNALALSPIPGVEASVAREKWPRRFYRSAPPSPEC